MGLFEKFEPVSEAQWKQKIQVDLKGADYNNTLITQTPEGINIKPFYHAENSEAVSVPPRATPSRDWYVSQHIYGGNADAANRKIKNILVRGAQGVIIKLPNKEINLRALFEDLPERGIQVHPEYLDTEVFHQINKITPRAYLHIDPIYRLAKTGNWFTDREKDLEAIVEFVLKYEGVFSNLTINTSTYQQAGANTVQELAYFLAHLNEYLNAMDQVGRISAFAKAKKKVNIDTAIGGNYFMQIGKYRAYRVLTRTLGDVYKLDLDAYITATPSLRNKSLLDYNNNMLRTTTECMSAILGGTDTLANLPYDAFFNKENEFGDRIARNQLLLLKEEAYFNEVSNPADGAYYIESLTKELVDKSLTLFKEIEKGGGFISALHEGTIQRKIAESAQEEQQKFDKAERVLVGVNKYKEAQPMLKKQYDVLPFLKIDPRKTLIKPIVEKRLAEEQEKEMMQRL
jgi:methylmalonyl-CoA mutase